MENIIFIGTVTLIHLLAVISPGPDFMMAVRNSLTYSRKTGIWTAFGFSLGIAVHIFYCIAGLALVISRSIIVFNFVKLLGAGYLIYIGVKSILSKSANIEIKEEEKREDISRAKALRIGFLTNILNPKATLFFLSLFTFVVKPETPVYILLILSVIMIVNTGLWFSLVAIFLTQKRVQKIFNRFQKSFGKVFGGLLIALGVKIALSKR